MTAHDWIEVCQLVVTLGALLVLWPIRRAADRLETIDQRLAFVEGVLSVVFPTRRRPPGPVTAPRGLPQDEDA